MVGSEPDHAGAHERRCGPVRRSLGTSRFAIQRGGRHNRAMVDASEIVPVSLDPDPVIEAYKKDVDRTLLRENLKLTVEERIQKMIAALRLVEEIRRSRSVAK